MKKTNLDRESYRRRYEHALQEEGEEVSSKNIEDAPLKPALRVRSGSVRKLAIEKHSEGGGRTLSLDDLLALERMAEQRERGIKRNWEFYI